MRQKIKLEYVKFNPSGNTTIIVDNRKKLLRREQYAEAASKLMQPESLCAEQVGYLENPIMAGALMRLHMMGGEFCGNATRCVAKLLCDLQTPGIAWQQDHTQCTVPLEVSGYPHVLEEKVMEYREESAKVYGGMPLPLKVEKGYLRGNDAPVIFVHFDGILHVILENTEFSELSANRLMENVREDFPQLEAVGLMYYNSVKGTMRPVVYVRETDSLVFESSCGSGSMAVAAAVCETTGKDVKNLVIRQPGGELEVSYSRGEGAEPAVLGGLISLVSRGTVWIELE